MEEFQINLWDRSRSLLNQLRFQARNRIAFSRKGYEESCSESERSAWLAILTSPNQQAVRDLEQRYLCRRWLAFNNLEHYRKNLATLWILEEIFREFKLTGIRGMRTAIDAGTQDFSRAPALRAFFHKQFPRCEWIGVELDAYPILKNGHSRFDIAQHFCKNLPRTRYLPGNIFLWKECAQFVSCFYPFVSPHPAIAWGLPKNYGDARAWIKALERILRNGGLALVIHQGAWEELEFDEAREELSCGMKLRARKILSCGFYESPHPLHASLYSVGEFL